MNLDILAFGAHRDDVEIMAGGTLLKMIDHGYKVGIVDLTQGEMGTRGDAATRKTESDEAAHVMGLHVRENLSMPDAGLVNHRENQLAVVGMLRKYRPRVVILPGLEQRHPDHALTPRLVYDACYLSGLEKLPAGGQKHRPFKILYAVSHGDFGKPSFLVDTSAQFERKLSAVRAYKTQFSPDIQDKAGSVRIGDVFEWIRTKDHAWGMMIGKMYAEAFTQREVHEVDDIVTLPVPSI